MPKPIIKKRILIVEDNEEQLKALYEFLVDTDHDVAIATHAEWASKYTNDKDIDFDMIISDHRMPGESGSAFLSKLDKNRKIIKVIYSGYSDDDGIKKALEQGLIHTFVSKKEGPTQLLKIITQLFEEHPRS